MDIRKIIREEVDAFDWADDITPIDSLDDSGRKNVYRLDRNRVLYLLEFNGWFWRQTISYCR